MHYDQHALQFHSSRCSPAFTTKQTFPHIANGIFRKIEELIRETREHREPTRLNEWNTEPDEIITALEAMLIPSREVDARKILIH